RKEIHLPQTQIGCHITLGKVEILLIFGVDMRYHPFVEINVYRVFTTQTAECQPGGCRLSFSTTLNGSDKRIQHFSKGKSIEHWLGQGKDQQHKSAQWEQKIK